MFTLGIISEKGGTSKTVTALGLAAAATRAGEAVAVIDVDPQTNAANWKDLRGENEPPAVVSAQASRLRQTLDLARANGADIAIIDSPGHNDSILTETARRSDLVLIPSRARKFDLETLSKVRQLLQVAGNPPAYVLLTWMHPLATTSAEQAKAMIETLTDDEGRPLSFKACPVHLSQLDIYGDAADTGKAPQEIEPQGKAAAELKELYMWICKQVDMLGGEDGEHGEHGETEQEARRLAKGA
jgi:chromosome partitioning protein